MTHCSMARRCVNPTTNIDLLGLPQLPEIPQIVLCLHFPGTHGWNKHWNDFNKKVKEFHQSMIDFNWKILEWYSLKSKQMDRFGMKSSYIAGTLVSGPRITIIYTRTLLEGDVTSEVKKTLPDLVKKDITQLERIGYKLCLLGKIFVFNKDRVVVIDYDRDIDKSFYRNCLKFILYERNEKINIFEAYSRVYGGLRSSFLLGGIGGLLVSLITGYFNRYPIYSRQYTTDKNLMWLVTKRWLASSIIYTVFERILLLRYSQPQRYILSGTTGAMCGMLLSLCDNSDPLTMAYATVEFGVYSILCNILISRHQASKKKCKEDYSS